MVTLVKAEEYRLMRILQVVHQYMPEYVGGTELHTRWLAEALSQSGHQVGVFYRVSGAKIELSHRIDAEELQVWSASTGEFSPMHRFLTTLGHSALLKLFQQALSEMKPDIVHIQHLMGLPVSIAQILQQKKIPYVITLHDYWWVCANAQLLTNYDQTVCDGPNRGYLNCAKCVLARGEKSKVLPILPPIMGLVGWRNKLLRGILNGASAIIAPSYFVANWYFEQGAIRQKPIVVPHGIPLPDILPRRDDSSKRGIRFGYIGGLSWQKGVHIAIEAFSGLRGASELWIVGDESTDPDYVSHLRELASDGVRFLGKLTRTEVWAFLAKIDVLLVPSLWYETFAFVMSEAFAMGVPVIASDIGALSERIDDGVNGRLAPPGDVSAWRKLMKGNWRRKMLNRARSSRLENVDQNTKHIIEIYQKIV